MKGFDKTNNDVFLNNEIFPSVGYLQIQNLKENVKNSSKGRVRLCIHKTNEDRQHEMFIAFDGSNYIRPSRHLGKDESLHILEGSGDYFFFDEKGKIIDVVSLGEYKSPYQFYCRINEDTDHALLIRSNEIVVHETTAGPFKREDTLFMGWSPEESNINEVKTFLSELAQNKSKERQLLKMKQLGEEVYVSDEDIVSIGSKEIAFLKNKVNLTQRKRVRLCIHKDIINTLHEMFVVYMSMTYVKPNLHVNKDESLHILEGQADFIFFDNDGNIIEIIKLGDYNSGRQFYIRVPAFKYHTIIMKSETLVIHEVTPGPFNRDDTIWAPWAPDENDPTAVEKFMSKLHEASSR